MAPLTYLRDFVYLRDKYAAGWGASDTVASAYVHGHACGCPQPPAGVHYRMTRFLVGAVIYWGNGHALGRDYGAGHGDARIRDGEGTGNGAGAGSGNGCGAGDALGLGGKSYIGNEHTIVGAVGRERRWRT